MKKILLVGSATMLLSIPAFASKARLQSLGQDKDGSYFIQDTRNMYANPAVLNNYSNFVTMEYGGAGYTAVSRSSLDNDNSPKAEGGVFVKSNNLHYGLMLGEENDVSSLLRILASNSAASFIASPDNVIEGFVAGGDDLKWGANFTYFNEKDETIPNKGSMLAFRFGVMKDNKWDAFLLAPVYTKTEDQISSVDYKYKGTFGIRLGGGYNYREDSKVFFNYENYAWKQTKATVETKADFTKIQLGTGHTIKVSDSANVYASITYDRVGINVKYATKAEINRAILPLVIGFETKANEWLTFRGAVTQNLWGQGEGKGLSTNFSTGNGSTILTLAGAKYGVSADKKKTIAGTTAVNAGTTMTFGNLSIDGLIGTSYSARNTTNAGMNATTSKGTLTLDGLESRVAMNYNF